MRQNRQKFPANVTPRFCRPVAAASVLCLILVVLNARSLAQEEHLYTLSGGFGGGVSPLLGGISDRLNTGWHITADGGFNVTHHFSMTAEYMYDGFGVSNRVLKEAQVPDGNAHLWSLTANPKLRLRRGHDLVPYVVGGVGYYRRTVEFTRPVLVQVFIFDPFFGVFYNTYVQANQVLGKITQGSAGGSLGAGFDIKLGNTGFKIFTEARYHYADTGRIPTRMVPVSFGIRW
jgi:opacity protein-like surface antigen